MREEEQDPTPRSPQIVRWHECRCVNVGRGECSCEDDGLVTHSGNYVEGLDHGVYRGFERARTSPAGGALRPALAGTALAGARTRRAAQDCTPHLPGAAGAGAGSTRHRAPDASRGSS